MSEYLDRPCFDERSAVRYLSGTIWRAYPGLGQGEAMRLALECFGRPASDLKWLMEGDRK